MAYLPAFILSTTISPFPPLSAIPHHTTNGIIIKHLYIQTCIFFFLYRKIHPHHPSSISISSFYNFPKFLISLNNENINSFGQSNCLNFFFFLLLFHFLSSCLYIQNVSVFFWRTFPDQLPTWWKLCLTFVCENNILSI